MKKIAFLASVFMIVACNNSTQQNKNQEVTEEKEVLLGGEKDKHGCIAAAGETWSELRQTCLQIFNEGKRLNPTEVKENEAVISAFVLFNEDKSKAELFLPSDAERNIILSKTGEHIYEAEKYKYDSQSAVLYIDSVEKYKGE
ncbi:MAG: hypothetical protein Q4C98_03180 [Capnocytophaga sp.]|nr:hypothetical protein [Capnocytophaga sp.]